MMWAKQLRRSPTASPPPPPAATPFIQNIKPNQAYLWWWRVSIFLVFRLLNPGLDHRSFITVDRAKGFPNQYLITGVFTVATRAQCTGGGRGEGTTEEERLSRGGRAGERSSTAPTLGGCTVCACEPRRSITKMHEKTLINAPHGLGDEQVGK